MNLFDILANAQGGNGIDALARQFGLTEQQTEQAVGALLPAFSQGLKRNAADPYGFGSFLSALSSGQHARYFDDATNSVSAQGIAEGNGILGHLFGSKDVSRAVAEQASQATGLGQQVLKQMLPAIATMLMGGLFKQTNNQMAAGGFNGSNNPLGDLIDQMMRQGGATQQQTRAPQPAPQQAPAGDNPFGKMLEDIFGAPQQAPGRGQAERADNPLGDILGQILRGGQPGQTQAPGRTTPQPSGNNPWGDILDQIMKGGQAGAEPQPEVSRNPTRRSGNPLEDIFGDMVKPGRQVDDNYQKGIDNIFEQYLRGMNRHR